MTPEQVLEACKSKLLAYCSLTNPNYQAPEHLVRIAKVLEAIERGEKKRVIITIPPRHGKSMICSQYFPAWYMGKHPDHQVISATYGQDLSDDFGRKVRDQLISDEFKAVFPDCEIDKRTTAASRLTTLQQGIYVSVGVGGALTGRGAHLLLIDDPIKDREQADSQLIRDKIWAWYSSVAYTRLMPGGSILVIMTRWHEDDLVARLLEQHSHENWELITLPALSEKGEPLWPQSYNLAALEAIRKNNEYDWQCLYQQDPLPKEGIIFKPEWMTPGLADEYACIFAACDPAISEKETADETAIVVVGVGFGDKPLIHEIETIHGRYDFETQLKLLKAVYKKYKPDYIGIEDVAYQKALIQEAMKLDMPIAALKTTKDKVARAMSVSHFFSQGRVRVNSPDLKKQMLSFRGGSEKNDLSDALIHAVGMVRDYSSERYVKPPEDYKLPEAMKGHEWFYRNSLQQEKDSEEGIKQHNFDKGYGGPSNPDFY